MEGMGREREREREAVRKIYRKGLKERKGIEKVSV